MKFSFSEFEKSGYSFVLLKNEKIIYRSHAQGLKPLISCIKKYKKEMRGAVVFDKIVGRAAAILLAYAKVKEVWMSTISRSGKAYLTRNKVKIDYKNLTNCIMNRQGNDTCPMEKMSRKMSSGEFIKKMLGPRR